MKFKKTGKTLLLPQNFEKAAERKYRTILMHFNNLYRFTKSLKENKFSKSFIFECLYLYVYFYI